jgi:hypothetical protein
MDKSLVLKEFTLPLAEDQLAHIENEWFDCEKDGELCGMIAIQPVVFVKGIDADPYIKVSILTAGVSEKLSSFITPEALAAEAKSKEPESAKNTRKVFVGDSDHEPDKDWVQEIDVKHLPTDSAALS